MTRKEAIEHFKAWAQCNYDTNQRRGFAGLSALTPPTQEQVERVWRSRWIHTMPVLGAGDIEIHCVECGNFGGYETDFCPYCGAAMTPEALEIIKERLEALNNGKGD